MNLNYKNTQQLYYKKKVKTYKYVCINLNYKNIKKIKLKLQFKNILGTLPT